MPQSSLRRAQVLGNASGLRRGIVLGGAASAIFVPLLVVDLGLILQLLVSRGGPGPIRDTGLGSRLLWQIVQVPLLGDFPFCLLVLVAASWGISLLEAGSLLWLRRLVNRYALRISTALRRAVHDQAFRLGPHDLLGTSRSRPEELFTDKAEAVRRGLVAWWQAIPRSLVELALLLVLAVAVNIWLTLLAVLLALYIFRFHGLLKRRGEVAARRYREQAHERCGELLGSLRLAPLATGYALKKPPSGSFDESLKAFQQAEFRCLTSESWRTPLLLFIVLVAISFVLLVVGLSEEATVPGTVLLGTALVYAYFPAARLYGLRERLDEANSAAVDLFAYLDRPPGVIQVEDARPLDRLVRDIKLDRVTIADRQGRRLLDNVSLTLPAGRVSVLLAADPETPMAVAGLFVRFYDPAAGRILYDDHDVCRATLDTVRGQAMLVTADGPLFPGTILANIACGDSGFTTLQISDAVKRVQAEEFLRELPEGLMTSVGGRDMQLRADQAFRIGLARALLREPSLLVIQEPDGHFDETITRELDAALKQAATGHTVVVLAPRLATLRAAECICLIHEGRLHAQGKHAELLQTSELYRHINYVRFNVFRDTAR